MNQNELSFAIFCIEWLAEELKIDPAESFSLLTEKSNILYEYIVPGYEALHTQGKEYLVRDIVELMKKRGIIE